MKNFRKIIQDIGMENQYKIDLIVNEITSNEYITNKDLLWIAHDLKKIGYLNSAILVLSKNRTTIEEKIPVIHLRGGYHIDNDDYDKAIIDFEEVIRLEKEINKIYCSEEAAFFLAICYKKISSKLCFNFVDSLPDDFETRFRGEFWNKQKVCNFVRS